MNELRRGLTCGTSVLWAAALCGGCFQPEETTSGGTADDGSTSSGATASSDGPDSTDGTDEADPSTSPSDETTGTQSACQDDDGDGFGNPSVCAQFGAGEMPPDYVADDTDCDDDDSDAFPGAAPSDDAAACMRDADGDEYGDIDPPGADVAPGTDCDDGDALVFPGGAANEDAALCMRDADGDGWGDPSPGTGVDPGMDCDDDDATAFPGAAPLDDPDACMRDADDDDYGDENATGSVAPGTDCNDSEAMAFPAAAEEEPCGCMLDADDDGYGDLTPPAGVARGHDCDDSDGGGVGACGMACPDQDNDDWGSSMGCVAVDPGDPLPPNMIFDSCDCEDYSYDVYPGAAFLDHPTACMGDSDNDGWGNAWPWSTDVAAGRDCVDSESYYIWPAGAFGGTPYNSTLMSRAIHPEAAQDEVSDECQLDYDDDGAASLSVPNPDPSYPYFATIWIESGTDPNDFNAGI